MVKLRKRMTPLLGAVMLAAVLLAGNAPAVEPVATTEYHGNVKSHVFHRPGCRYYSCKSYTIVFTSREQALAAGYRPCKVCQP